MSARLLQVTAAVIGAVLLVGAVFWPQAAAGGWLAAFDYWAGVPLGATGLLMIHRLVGGEWGEAMRPGLKGSASAMPLLLLGIVPVFIAMPVLFAWFGGAHARPDVLAHYLNWPFYLARSVILLAGFSVFAIMMARGRGGMGLAAIGVIFYAVALTAFAIDWVLAIRPATSYTGFGPATAIEYLSAALAWTVLTLPAMPQRTRSDLAGLMLALVLGAIYLNYMDYLTMWYGDVPEMIAWFVPRSAMPWKPFLLAGLVFGGVGPLLALLFGRTRYLPDNLEPAAASVLFGFACYEIWQVLPAFGVLAVPFAVLAMLAIGLFAMSLLPRRLRAHQTQGAAHG
jgi:hypothetical protein